MIPRKPLIKPYTVQCKTDKADIGLFQKNRKQASLVEKNKSYIFLLKKLSPELTVVVLYIN